TTCITCSGPTPSHGSGGSPLVSGPLLRARPSKPGCPIAGADSFTVASTTDSSIVALAGARPGVAFDPGAPLVSGFPRCGTGPVVRRSVALAMLPCAAGRFWRRSLDDFWWRCEVDWAVLPPDTAGAEAALTAPDAVVAR